MRKALSLLKDVPMPDNLPPDDKSAEIAPLEWINNRLIYAEQQLYCPFLRDGVCSIYQVRPLYCAGYISTSPSELCNHLNPDHYKIKRNVYQAFERDSFNDLSFYVEELSKPVWSFIPMMVFDVLRYGPEALYKMQIFNFK